MSKGRWENGVNWRHPQRMQFKQAGSHGNMSCGGNSMGQPQFLFDFWIRRKFETVFLTWLVFWLVVYLSIVIGVRQRAAYLQFRTLNFLSENLNFIKRNHKCLGKDKTPSTYEQSQSEDLKIKFSELELTKTNTIHHKECWGGRRDPTLLPSQYIPWDKPIHTLGYKFQKSHLILKPFSLKIWKQEDINSSLVGVRTTTIGSDFLTVKYGGARAGLMRTSRSVPSYHVTHRHRITLLN